MLLELNSPLVRYPVSLSSLPSRTIGTRSVRKTDRRADDSPETGSGNVTGNLVAAEANRRVRTVELDERRVLASCEIEQPPCPLDVPHSVRFCHLSLFLSHPTAVRRLK